MMQITLDLVKKREIADMLFKTINVEVPSHDCDVEIVFPGGEKMIVQCRPSNASESYEGSLDIILPKDQIVLVWEGDDMKPSKSVNGDETARIAKQLVTELPVYT